MPFSIRSPEPQAQRRAAENDLIALVEAVVAVGCGDRCLSEFAGVEAVLLGELVDGVDVGVGAVDDEHRLVGGVVLAPPVPVVGEGDHGLGSRVVQAYRVVLLKDRDGFAAVARRRERPGTGRARGARVRARWRRGGGGPR